MQACHWKAHNTFINFYLKDLTGLDYDKNMYLRPVVVTQQVLDPSSQTSCIPRRKSGILRIQYGHAAAAAAEISFWTR